MAEDGNATMIRLERKLWLTADKDRVVEDGSDEAAFLLGGPGDEIAEQEAERLGLKKQKAPANKQAPAPENKAADAPAEKPTEAPAKKAGRTRKRVT